MTTGKAVMPFEVEIIAQNGDAFSEVFHPTIELGTAVTSTLAMFRDDQGHGQDDMGEVRVHRVPWEELREQQRRRGQTGKSFAQALFDVLGPRP